MWLPALCRAKHVPYVICKGRSQLGSLVHQKNAAVLAITSVNEGDNADLAKIATYAKENFNDAWAQIRTQWGGKKLSQRSIERQRQNQLARQN
jgi:large subunit ribosomal protein L7Ae